MKTGYSMATTKVFVGAELEKAWADFCHGVMIGGLNDGGYDIATRDVELPKFQVKGHPVMARKHLALSLKFQKFIPLTVGEPPRYTSETREREWTKVRDIILLNGGYVAADVPQRELLVEGVRRVRAHLAGT